MSKLSFSATGNVFVAIDQMREAKSRFDAACGALLLVSSDEQCEAAAESAMKAAAAVITAGKRSWWATIFFEESVDDCFLEKYHGRNYDEYLQSESWKSKRKVILNRDNHTCQSCLSERATQVHHLTYDRKYNELPNDLVSLCSDCHREIHGK